MTQTILFVGAEASANTQLTGALAHDGFAVRYAGDAISGLFQLASDRPALVIVDVDDCEILKRMRRVSSAPIIALARDDGSSGLKSLASGADYYVLKPPKVGELCAKVRASLRRS